MGPGLLQAPAQIHPAGGIAVAGTELCKPGLTPTRVPG
jgi:hypothetical protein